MILEWSNFSGKGPAPAGEYQGIGPYGTFDMAGNVKEWCANRRAGPTLHHGRRLERAELSIPAGGCATGRRPIRQQRPAAGDAARPGAVFQPRHLDPVERLTRDYRIEKPVSDDLFKAFARLYSYDASDLKSTVEASTRRRTTGVSSACRTTRRTAGSASSRICSCRKTRAAVPDGRLLPARGGLRAGLVPAGRDGVPGLSREVGTRAAVSDVQGHYERRLKTPPSRTQRRARRHDSASERRRPVDRLPADAARTSPAIGSRSSASAWAPPSRRSCSRSSGGSRRPSSGRADSDGPRPPENDPINFAPRVGLRRS